MSDNESLYNFSDEIFHKIRDISYQKTGINFGAKKGLIYTRLIKRLRELDIDDFNKYCSLIIRDKAEFSKMINILTTNVTYFFRESHQFEYLIDTACPELLEKHKSLSLWSAGCSSGQEPYSLAMLFEKNKIPYSITASDLDSNVLNKANKGIYSGEQLDKMPNGFKSKWFTIQEPKDENLYQISNEIRKNVKFKQINLIEDWNYNQKAHIIFCRNVFIYFDKETKSAIMEKFHQTLHPGGYLFLGHSENVDEGSIFTKLPMKIFKKI